MTALDWRERLFAATLSALAGFVDAAGFLALGGFFVSFMSGNTTRLGVGLMEAWPNAVLAAGLIAAFVLGVASGGLIGRRGGGLRANAVMAFTAAALLLAAYFHTSGQAVIAGLILAMAMGATNAVFSRENGPPLGLTYVTGALVRLGQALADRLDGRPVNDWRGQALLWGAMAVGAIAGAATHFNLGAASLWPAAGLACVLAVLAPRARASRGG